MRENYFTLKISNEIMNLKFHFPRAKLVLLFLIVFTVTFIHSQDKKHIINRFEGQQPNSNINVTMFHNKESTASGQNFGMIIRNLTQHKIKVYGRYFANLICGNAKNGNIAIEMKPGETMGGESYSFETNGLTETTFNEDCKAVNNNRIKKVGFQITGVTDLTQWEQEKSVQPPNNRSSNNSPSTNNNSNSNSSNTNSRSRSTNSDSNNSNRYNQTQAIMNDLNRNLQNTQKTYNAVTDGLQQLGDLLQQQQERKTAQREAIARQRQQEEEEKRQQRDLEAQQKAQRITEMEENNRRAEVIAKAERERQFEIDKQTLGNVTQDKNPDTFSSTIKQVYYIVYERNYANNKVNVKTYTLNIYSDGTWMLSIDLQNKINFKNYFGNNGVGFLLGAYANKQTALELLNRIRANFSDASIDKSFLLLNGTAIEAGSDKNFWNN